MKRDPTFSRWQVLLPSEQILHSVRLSQRLEREAREEVQSRQREAAGEWSCRMCFFVFTTE